MSSRNRQFAQWVSSAPPELRDLLQAAESEFCRLLTSVGFVRANHAFDTGAVPPHCLNFERRVQAGFEYVLVAFEKHYAPRFQIIFGLKGPAPGYRWVRAGSLVWKSGARAMSYKWWGARWWSLDKRKRFERSISAAAARLSQAVTFLESGHAGANVCVDNIRAPDGGGV